MAETSSGEISGYITKKGISAFLGIPYAKPPVGDLRFAAPQEIGKWESTKKTIEFGPSCPQFIDESEPASLYKQDEDCLSLNIWTPGLGGKKRPVIVYIHGGAFTNGGTSDPLYNGATISQRGDIVFASVNYRVNAFGFLYLEDFGAQFKGSGNIAVQDQLMGIRWIKKNIANFGGDPDNITLMGESAGSMSTLILMGLPQAQGLFKKVIAESGASSTLRTKEQASRSTKLFFETAGVNDVASLRAMPKEKVVKAVKDFLSAGFEGLEVDRVFMPVVDGSIIPVDPMKAIEGGASKGITLLNGTTLDEYRYWINFYDELRFIPLRKMMERNPNLKERVKGKDKEVLAFYEKKFPDQTLGDSTLEFVTDSLMRIPHIQVSEAQSKYSKVWMYRFDWKSQVKDYLGACHAIELPFVLKTFDSPTNRQIVGPNPPMELSDMMQDAWIAFAHSGDPNHKGMPEWPAYDAERRATMIFNTKSEVMNDPDKDVRLFYKGITY